MSIQTTYFFNFPVTCFFGFRPLGAGPGTVSKGAAGRRIRFSNGLKHARYWGPAGFRRSVAALD